MSKKKNKHKISAGESNKPVDLNFKQLFVIYSRLFKYIKPYWGKFILAVVIMFAYGSTEGVIPLFLKEALDRIFTEKDESKLFILPLALIVFGFVRGALGFFERYLSAAVGINITKDVRAEVNQVILRLSAGYFSQHTSGNLSARMINDTNAVRSMLTDNVSAILRDIVRITALFCTAVYLDPFFALITFVSFPIGLYPIILFSKKVRRFAKWSLGQFADLTSLFQESVIGLKVIQSFSLEDFAQKRFLEINNNMVRLQLKVEKYSALSTPTNELIGMLAIAIIICIGGMSVLKGERTPGDFIAVIVAVFLVYDPLKRISKVLTAIQAGTASVERVFEILDTQPDIVDKPDALDEKIVNPTIEYRNVSFTYPDGTLALQDISFKVRCGETVALVGMSGGGKSTIVNLLSRFYDSQVGAVLINDVDIRERTLASVRGSLANVSQNTFLFNDTIYNNILYGRLGATQEEVIAVAKIAQADNFISKLPQGYETKIGEQGLRLSGGERARIALARALIKDAPILILDEATAALDSESEKFIQDALDLAVKGRTVIAIAHRLSTIVNADMILVVVDGKIIERGTHLELLQRGGEYAKLYKIQYQGKK
ncbi:MAG: ATP-binding cassette domain-containing protein [Deltaproteobacteria bacterium]|jgi:subfamily B ATP-binding cassette protein MsbA|nr:ATP-binding cassette domain-containing protein [Deltaproteobacteria bacterium]